MRLILAGGSSPLGRDLAREFTKQGHSCVVMSRSPKTGAIPYSSLNQEKPDAILNLIGGHRDNPSAAEVKSALTLGEGLLVRAIELSVPLVHLSSGTAMKPTCGPVASHDPLRNAPFQSPYQELKVRLEELHDAHSTLTQILDLRLFSFVGQNFLTGGKYLLSEAFTAIRENKLLNCSSDDFVRDFSGASEIVSAIESAFRHGVRGKANLYSGRAVSKFEVLEGLRQEFGLNFSITAGNSISQSHYYAASDLQLPGFDPRSSLEVIFQEFRKALVPTS